MTRRLVTMAVAVLLATPAFAQNKSDKSGWETGTFEEGKQKATWEKGNNVKENIRHIELFAGLGAGNFAGNLGELTSTGLSWQGRVGIQPLRNVGGEFAYQGISANVNTIIQSNGNVLQNQSIRQHAFTFDAKVGAPFTVAERQLNPYALVGLGYSRVNVNISGQAVGLQDDNQFAVPLGVGATYALTNTWGVDGRFTWNFLSGVSQPLARNSGDSWTAIVNVGARIGQ